MKLDKKVHELIQIKQIFNEVQKIIPDFDSNKFISEENFRAYEFCHRIPKGSKYDWKEGKKKYGYILGEVVKLDSPIELPVIKGNRMWRELE